MSGTDSAGRFNILSQMDEPNVPLPRDLSEHIPLIVTTNICVTTFLCRCNNKYLDIIWKLHCYNLSALLQQLCVEIILLQLLNVVTVFITTYSLNVVTMEYFIVTVTITSFEQAPWIIVNIYVKFYDNPNPL